MKNKKNYIIAFIIPLIIMILLYTCVGVGPTLKKNILTMDLAGQYVAFLNALKNILTENMSPLYSFSKTLGGNMFGLITYYVISPFNLILIFFDRINIPDAIYLINILKIGFAGLTSYIYFSKTYKQNNITTLIFSNTYALMAYNIVYSQNIMWLDGVILLPLIFYGIDKLIEGKPTMFYITLTISIICNYYIGYMTCIGSLIYYIYKLYIKKNYTLKKDNIKDILYFIKYLLLAVGTSSIILIPSILSLLSGKAEGTLTELIPNQKFAIIDIISRFFIGSFENKDLSGGLPNVYISILMLSLTVNYFLNKKIDKKERNASLILIVIFVASFSFYTLDVIWHTFHHPVGFPFRYSFIFDFIILIIAYKGYINKREIETNLLKKILALSLVITLIMDKLMYDSSMYYKMLGTFILFCVYMIYIQKSKKKVLAKSIVLLVMLEMFTNSVIIFSNIKYQDKNSYKDFINNYGTIIDDIQEKDKSFYRIEKNYSYSTNDELLLNYKGISHFSSVYEESNNKLLRDYLGIFNRFYVTNYLGSTLVTNSLFNIKYLLLKDEVDYYDKISETEKTHIYINQYNLPLAYIVDNGLEEVELKKLAPFENQNKIIKSMNKSNEYPFQRETRKVTSDNIVLSEKNGDELVYKKINDTQEASMTFTTTLKNTGLVYAYLSSNYNKKVDIKFQGKSIISNISQNGYRYNILELGNFKKDDVIELKVILLESTLKVNDYMIYTLDMQKFSNDINKMQMQEQLNITSYRDDYITGTITVKEDNQLLYTSIPYDKGFKVKVDGKETNKIKLLDTFIGVELEKGTHTIEFIYTPRGLKIGTILSLISLIIFIISKKNKNICK